MFSLFVFVCFFVFVFVFVCVFVFVFVAQQCAMMKVGGGERLVLMKLIYYVSTRSRGPSWITPQGIAIH